MTDPASRSSNLLAATSSLSVLFATFHLGDDIVRGFGSPGPSALVGVVILAVWLYGTLALPGRRAGQIIVLLGSLLGAAITLVHLKGPGVGDELARSRGAFFFVWTLIALGITSLLSAVLALHGLWKAPRVTAR
jgi:hypothetical protein